MVKKAKDGKWMSSLKLKKGALHRAMDVAQGKKIPVSKINAKISALKKKSAGKKKLTPSERTLQRRLVLAKTFKKAAKRKKGK